LINKLPTTATGIAIALGTFGQMPVEAANLNFDRMIVFGDSLSDTGNFSRVTRLLTGTPFPNRPFYKNGRFSNGNVWVEPLAKDLGLSGKVTNFAIGGSTSGSENFGLSGIPAGLKQQIDLHQLFTLGQPADPDDLYVVWSGSNDFFGGLENLQNGSSTPDSLIQTTVNNVSNALTTLANKGAGTILVPNLADLGQTPLSRTTASEAPLSFLTQGYNAALAGKLSELGSRFPETNFISFDVNGLVNELRADPGRFGLTNITEACTNTNLYDPNTPITSLDPSKLTICDRPNQYLFWDSVHPTGAGHRIIADRALEVLESSVYSPYSLEIQSEGGQLEVLSASAIPLATSVSVPEPNSASSLLVFGALGGVTILSFRNRLWQ
jgi:phospholipase/lecithinase/hemolysin